MELPEPMPPDLLPNLPESTNIASAVSVRFVAPPLTISHHLNRSQLNRGFEVVGTILAASASASEL